MPIRGVVFDLGNTLVTQESLVGSSSNRLGAATIAALARPFLATNLTDEQFAEMLGGWFNGHPWHQEIGVIVEDRDHPATAMLGDGFRVTDEVYTFKNWDRSKTNVLMRLDNETVDLSKGNRDDEDYALGWYHEYGEGRVIYSALGHPDMLWRQSWFKEHVAACVEWVGKR